MLLATPEAFEKAGGAEGLKLGAARRGRRQPARPSPRRARHDWRTWEPRRRRTRRRWRTVRPPDALCRHRISTAQKAHHSKPGRALPSRVTHPWRHRARGEAAAVNDGYVCCVSTRACAMVSSASYPIVVSRQPPLVARVQPHRETAARRRLSSSFSGAVRALPAPPLRFRISMAFWMISICCEAYREPRGSRPHRLQTRAEALELEPVAIPVAQRAKLGRLFLRRLRFMCLDEIPSIPIVSASAEDARRGRVPLVPPRPAWTARDAWRWNVSPCATAADAKPRPPTSRPKYPAPPRCPRPSSSSASRRPRRSSYPRTPEL